MTTYDAVHCATLFGAGNVNDPDGECTESSIDCKCECGWCMAAKEQYLIDSEEKDDGET